MVLDTFFECYALEGLLECPELKEMTFYPHNYGQGLEWSTQKTLRKFGKWLHEGFRKSGREIEVRLRDERGLECTGRDEELMYNSKPHTTYDDEIV
jgi:hypothetical protein